jgi:hypothetical protein
VEENNMSYEKVKSVTIDLKNKKINVVSACNNVRPLSFEKWELTRLQELLKEPTKENIKKIEIEILKLYESGEFHQYGTDNKFSKADKYLNFVLKEEYNKYSWKNHFSYKSPEYEQREENRKSTEFEELLYKAYIDSQKIKTADYILTKNYFGTKIYGKSVPTGIKWNRNIKNATKFYFKEEAENLIKAVNCPEIIIEKI